MRRKDIDNMQYINAKEFLYQPKEVQEAFIDWWKPSKGDIYCNLYNGQEDNVLVINQCQFNFKSFRDDIKRYGIPLLTEGQLRKVIVKITGKNKVGAIHIPDYNNYCKVFIGQWIYLKSTNNILKAYWEVACEIIKDKLKERTNDV